MTDYFVEENRIHESQRTYSSPSGKYTLTVDSYGTRSGGWNYTRGRVYDLSGNLVADIKRNYSTFWRSWITTPDGREWLMCGESYLSQTLVNLQTGKKISAPKGDEFCWTDAELLSDGVTLLVQGCYWACPYEYRLVDFSNPDEGWSTLQTPCLDLESFTSVYLEGEFVVWRQDFRIWKATGESEMSLRNKRYTLYNEIHRLEVVGGSEEEIQRAKLAVAEHDEIYRAVSDDEDGDEEISPSTSNPDLWEIRPYHIVKMKRTPRLDEKGEKVLDLVEEWNSEEKLEYNRLSEEYDRKRTEEASRCRSSDEVYQFFKSDSDKIWKIYPSLWSKWEGETNPFFNSLQIPGRHTIEWGATSGDILVKKSGHTTVLATYPRTIEGAQEALRFSETRSSSASST